MLELCKTVTYKFWYDYVKPKYGKRQFVLYGYRQFHCVHKADEDIAKDVETIFDTSICELNRSLSRGKNKKVIDVMKNKLGGKVLKEFIGLRAKTCSYLIDDSSEDKKARGTKLCVKEGKL